MNSIEQPHWRWAGASVTGQLHHGLNEGGQDSGSLKVHSMQCGPVLVIAVCDGAGSAKQSKSGSQLAAIRIQKIVATYLKGGGTIEAINHDVAAGWIGQLSMHLAGKAEGLGCELRELSTTLTLVVVAEGVGLVVQVGDSACALCCDGQWRVPVWPMNGEYANLTYFVTKYPRVPIGFATVRGAINQVAVFSDGMTDILLDHRSKTAFAPAFEGLFAGAQLAALAGRDRSASNDLGQYLQSEIVCERSDDDKTLIMAARC